MLKVNTGLPAVLNPEQRLKLTLVEDLVGFGKSKIYAKVAAGEFPKPERDGPKCSRWRAGDVLDYLNARRGVSQ